MSDDTIKSAFALIENEGKIVLIQEGSGLGYGLWCLPGGHMDKDENPAQAAFRETVEETGGLTIEIGDEILAKTITNEEYTGRPEETGRMIELRIFKARPISGKIDPARLTEELDVKWFTKDEAKKLPLRWPWLKDLF